MKLDASKVQLQFTCLHCGEKIPETIGRLKENPNLTCPACGKVNVVNSTELDKGIKSAEKMLKDFGRGLSGKFK